MGKEDTALPSVLKEKGDDTVGDYLLQLAFIRTHGFWTITRILKVKK